MIKKTLANILFYFDLSIHSNSQEPSNNIVMDIEINTVRGWSNNSSTNNSRALSVYSNIFSIRYAEQIQNIANNTTWADQVEISKFQGPALSYNISTNNICNLQDLEPSTITYSVYQPTDPQL